MKFDVKQLKKMNDLDFDQVAIWPNEIKIVVATVVAIAAGALAYYLIIDDKLPVLENAQAKELELKATYQAKYHIAVNIDAYKLQLERIKKDFSSMLKSLPTSNETPGLLDDITYVGTTAGLTFKVLNWQPEIPKEFYTELPIEIEVTGSYHEFGRFVSNIANLPRIVTLHDFDLSQDQNLLTLKMQAKTYRTASTEQVTASTGGKK